jgi:hypothetical protein
MPESAFRWDEYCQYGFGTAKRDTSEVDVKECIIEQCRISLGTWKFRDRRIWTEAEAAHCLAELAAAYDELNVSFDEPNFRDLPTETTALRLYAVGSLTFAHVMVRVIHQPTGNVLVTKRLESNEIVGQGRLAWRHVSRIDPSEWQRIEGLLAKAKFWDLPSRTDTREFTTKDGTKYILEGADGAKHHLVQAVRPTGAREDLIQYLMRLAVPARIGGQCAE